MNFTRNDFQNDEAWMRYRACESKVAHATFERAVVVAVDTQCQVYKCGFCGKYHLSITPGVTSTNLNHDPLALQKARRTRWRKMLLDEYVDRVRLTGLDPRTLRTTLASLIAIVEATSEAKNEDNKPGEAGQEATV